jgi:ubiquinone/menaquinone biosynthesis C-methylase UbiE
MPIQSEHEHDIIQWNEEMARKYDPEAYHLHSNFLIRWIERRRVKAILRLLHTGPEEKVLEVGSGAGNVLEQIPSRRLYGIDLSAFLLKKSRKRLAHRQATIIGGNAERLPFANGQFDRLICSEVLEHVANPRQVVAEMARVAAADATFVISVPNEMWINRVKGIIRALGLKRWLLQGNNDSYSSPDQMTDEWHLHYFGLELLQETLENILLIRQIKTIPFDFIPLRYVANCKVIEPVDQSRLK